MCVCEKTTSNSNDLTVCYRASQLRPTGGPHNSLRNHLRAALVYEGVRNWIEPQAVTYMPDILEEHCATIWIFTLKTEASRSFEMLTFYKSVRCLNMSEHHIDSQDAETSELIVVYHVQFKSGLANFSPRESHIILKGSTVCRTGVYIHRRGWTVRNENGVTYRQ